MSKAAVVQFPEIKKTRLYYVDKKTNKQKRLSDNIFRDLQYITRANDPSKKIIYRDWETDRKSTRLNSSHRL